MLLTDVVHATREQREANTTKNFGRLYDVCRRLKIKQPSLLSATKLRSILGSGSSIVMEPLPPHPKSCRHHWHRERENGEESYIVIMWPVACTIKILWWSWGCIFSHVRPCYEWTVSNLDRCMHRSLWVYVTHILFIEGSHTTKNTASAITIILSEACCIYQ